MKTYKVTVYNETPWGGFIPEQKTMKAVDLNSLYSLLKERGYKRYFIGSLIDPVIY